MTLVASLVVDKFPLLVGDLLTSGPETGDEIYIPTTGSHTGVFPAGSGWTIRVLVQKIAVVGDNLIVGWSGPRFAAKTLIKELIAQNSSKPFTFELLRD